MTDLTRALSEIKVLIEMVRARDRALGFAASVIKSGEEWTETCEREIGDLLRASGDTPPAQEQK